VSSHLAGYAGILWSYPTGHHTYKYKRFQLSWQEDSEWSLQGCDTVLCSNISGYHFSKPCHLYLHGQSDKVIVVRLYKHAVRKVTTQVHAMERENLQPNPVRQKWWTRDVRRNDPYKGPAHHSYLIRQCIQSMNFLQRKYSGP